MRPCPLLLEAAGAHCHTGKIYAGYDICSGEEVAIKLEPCANGYLHLENEYKSYQILGRQCAGIPQMKWFGIVEGYTAMALNLLGPSLEELFISNNRKFTLGTVSIIADQMVSLTAINCIALHDHTTLVAIFSRIHPFPPHYSSGLEARQRSYGDLPHETTYLHYRLWAFKTIS